MCQRSGSAAASPAAYDAAMEPRFSTFDGASDRWTDDPAFAALEDAYGAYQDAWGAWMVGHHRGAPIEAGEGGGHAGEAALTENLVGSRRVLGERIAAIDAERLGPTDLAALANIRASLPDLDAWPEPLDGLEFAESTPARDDDEPEIAGLRRSTFEAWGSAMADLRVDGECLDRLSVAARLGREPDPAARNRLFVAMAPGWAVLDGPGGPNDGDGPYRRLVRASAARWRRDGSPVAANAAALGMDPAAVEPTMRKILAAFRRVAMPPELVEPWDYRYVTGGLARRLDAEIPLPRLRPINDAHLAGIGADPGALGITYDIVPRPGRPIIPTAFTVSLEIARRTATGWRPARPWVFATYTEGGLGNLEELLHESGHALHYAALRARPAFSSWPADQTAFVEAVADIVGWTVHEPAFLARHLGASVATRESVISRYAGVMLDACWTLFELELHRHPERAPNEVWAEIAEGDLGVVGHPEWSWWGHRGQLIDGPGYLANYALGAVMVAAVRARIREVRGDWAEGDPGWNDFVAEHLLRFAGARSPRDILLEFLGGPLTAGPLLADLARGA
ncbi:MAG: hypothetical protein A2V84_07330 [Chloroflexi bacterium RBG_16_70_13]|nr:MAG: hypothetical protein A2V84_07330 [Chloroflexi bacterium RBG_16_70_13]